MTQANRACLSLRWALRPIIVIAAGLMVTITGSARADDPAAGVQAAMARAVVAAGPATAVGHRSISIEGVARAFAEVPASSAPVRTAQLQRAAYLKSLRRRWSCVPFARELTGVDIKGDAWRWWGEAAGRYDRGNRPLPGSIIVFSKSRSLGRGHVGVVREIVNAREIVIDHANWAPRGRISLGAHVIDVSANNDWSRTRVWHEPTGQYGTGVYPVYGFIYAEETQVASRPEE
jgi:surface antigen